MTGAKCVINVCTCMCEETENGCKIGKKKSKFQVALLFLFTPQAQSDLCLLESLNFNSLEESLVCPYLPLEGGCAGAPMRRGSGQFQSRALPFLCLTSDL